MASQQPNEAAKARAEERFKVREQRASDADKAMQDTAAATEAERAKTIRLRSLRLAKEEADRIEAAAKPIVTKKARALAKSRKPKAVVSA